MNKLILRFIAIGIATLVTGLAQADLGDQLIKITASDGAPDDLFGNSVAVSGTTAIVGSFNDDDNGVDSGSAYIYNTTTGQQLFKLLASDGATGDLFGRSAAIKGTTAIVGANGDDDNGSFSGSAYIFDTTTGLQLFKLLPNDGSFNGQFGISVSISGTTAIIGAHLDNENGASSGSAYLFDITTGQQIHKLLPSDGAIGDNFGWSVSISGTTAIVGARGDDDNSPNSGSAYLFDTITGNQLFKLLPNDGAGADSFGSAVAIYGATAIVGARFDDDNGGGSGSAFIFDTTTGTQLIKLLPSDGAANDNFGLSVAINGTTAIIGAPLSGDNDDFLGAAYLFDTSTGEQLTKFLPDDLAVDDEFGNSVAISGTTVIVGSQRDDDNGSSSGASYIFDARQNLLCLSDLNGDGLVDTADLGILLGEFGLACP